MPPSSVVLNVDDNEVARFARSATLRRAGFSVHEAGTGAEALARMSAVRPDLVLLDVNLPDIDGFELCRRIKRHPATASVLVLHVSASFVEPGARVRGLENGADGYIIEPADPQEVVATVRALLRLRRAETERDEALLAVREREHLLRTVLDNLPDRAGKVVIDNPAGRAMLAAARPSGGADAGGDGSGRSGLLPDTSADSPLGRALWRGETVINEVADIGKAPGSVWTIVSSAVPVRAEDGTAVGAVLVSEDISERRRIETERERLRRAAEDANRLKDEFLAVLSHELRTPLNSILGWAQMLLAGRLDERTTRRAYEAIHRSAQAQTALIADVLDVSRIESGKMRLDVRPVELGPVIQAAVDAVSPAAAAKHIDVHARLPEKPVTTWGDADRLQQVFWNLLSNAVKFTPSGGRVETAVKAEPGQITVEVRDTGMGIDPEFLPHVFERFRQADSSASRSHMGLGLGLSIVRHLVEMHGGTVGVTSRGRAAGSTFAVCLPAYEATAAGRPGAIAEAPARPGQLLGVKVLVVDDEPDAVELLTVALAAEGASVITAASAGEALERLQREKPDVIVSDIGMPETDGIELVRRIRALPAARGGTVRTVAVTAYGRTEDRVQAVAAGYDLHLSKPISPRELVSMVAALKKAGRPQSETPEA
jgi:signal transduction histidine kinase